MILRNYRLVLLFLVIQIQCLLAQKVAFQEGLWALVHPFAAIKIKAISRQCDIIYRQNSQNPQVDDYASGGRKDAYRHVFYMAAFAQKLRTSRVLKLGRAHEKTNYRQFKKRKLEQGELADSMLCVMDLKNNDLGCQLGKQNPNLSLEQLNELSLKTIVEGKAVILKRNKKGQYLNCSNNPITEGSEKKWASDKCLVPSNYNYMD